MIPLAEHQYAALAAIAEAEAGLYMPASKKAFVTSRLQRRLRQAGIADFDAYLRIISGSGPASTTERLNFVAALTTNVTGVYREPHHFALLAQHLRRHFPRSGMRKYQIWSAGCSTGEEPLSMAATCQAVLGPGWSKKVKILATDVDDSVLRKARDQSHDEEIAVQLANLPEGVGEARPTSRTPIGKLIPSLQEGIQYRQHNLMRPLDAGPFDAIFCRNVTIYFSRVAQECVHATLRTQLSPTGLLAIGHSEQLLGNSPRMTPAGRTAFHRVPESGARQNSPEIGSSWH